MTLSAAEWLRRSRSASDAFWKLPAEQFRLAMWLLSVAEFDGTDAVFSCVSDELAYHLALTKGKLARALEALEQAGFCQVQGQRGRGGRTTIVILAHDPFSVNAHDGGRSIFYPGDINGESKCTEPIDGKLRKSNGAVIMSGDLEVVENTGPSDLDLYRSPKISDPDLRSDLRSRTYENIRLSALSGRIIWADGVQPDHSERWSGPQIPDRAWTAADYLRGQVLAENRSAVVGIRRWGEEKTGLRLAWANEFRLLHSRVLRAMRNERADVAESSAWDEIAKTVHWLFHRQPPPPGRFEVESPSSLARKWDAIQRARRRLAQPQQARGADSRPDPQAQRTFKRLGEP